MSQLSEGKGVEIPVYDWLSKMGWTPRTSADLKVHNRPLSNPLIEGILIERVSKINGVSLADAKRAVDILKNTFANPSNITANEEFLDLLCSGVNLTIEGEDRTLKLIDFDNIWNNDFTVTRQYHVQGIDLVKPDLVCMVNGIPLIPFEAKQRAQQNSNWLKGVGDLGLYESKIPKMIVCNLFGVACNGRLAKFGVPGASSSYFAEWKDLSVDTTAINPLLDGAQMLCPVKPDKDGSFDAGHQFSLMDTIRSYLRNGAVGGVPDGLQFIILSHDTSLEKYFDRLNGTLEWHHQKLQGMPPRGRVMVSARQADRLKAQAQQYLNAGQIDIGEPFVRQYLEYKLGQVITRLGVLVPPDYATRGDKRTLSTYMDAITGAVGLYQAAGRCVLTRQQISDLQTRHASAIMSNYVSHYEGGVGTPFNAYALLGVLQSVDDLAACFVWTDPSDGQMKYYRALDRQ